MHTLGKVFLFMVIVLSVLAVFLTTGLLSIRGEWVRKIEEEQQKITQQREDLRQRRATVAALQRDVNRVMYEWGRTWETAPDRSGVLDANQAAIQLGVGPNAGLGRELLEQQTPGPVYVFGVNQNGPIDFFGTFRLVEPSGDGNSMAAQLARPALPGEAQTWQADGAWRIRESIPESWRSLFAGIQSQMTRAAQDLQDMEGRLQMQEALIAKSNEQLQRRLAELEGNPNAREGARQDVVDGLVATLRQEESSRNTELHTLDDLRHQFDRKYEELLALLEENETLRGRLPQPPASAPDAAPGGDPLLGARLSDETAR